MQTRVTLQPGRKGTKALTEAYGDRLVCVRYRYDPVNRRRLKTVEIILEERPWVYCPREGSAGARDLLVAVRFEERGLRAAIKSVGGRWRPDRKAWAPPLGTVRQLGLTGRIIQ